MINMEVSNQLEYKSLFNRCIQNDFNFIFNMDFDKKINNINSFIKYIHTNPTIDKYSDDELLGIILYYFEKIFCFINPTYNGEEISNIITKERFGLINNPRFLNIAVNAITKVLNPNSKGICYLTEYEKTSFFMYIAYLYNNKSIKTSETATILKKILIFIFKDIFDRLIELTNDEQLSFDILLSCKKIYNETEKIRLINTCLITNAINIPVDNIIGIYLLFETSCTNILIQTIIDNQYSIPTNIFMTEQTSIAALDIVDKYLDIDNVKTVLMNFVEAYSNPSYTINRVLRFSLTSISAMSYPTITKAIEELQSEMIFVP